MPENSPSALRYSVNVQVRFFGFLPLLSGDLFARIDDGAVALDVTGAFVATSAFRSSPGESLEALAKPGS